MPPWAQALLLCSRRPLVTRSTRRSGGTSRAARMPAMPAPITRMSVKRWGVSFGPNEVRNRRGKGMRNCPLFLPSPLGGEGRNTRGLFVLRALLQLGKALGEVLDGRSQFHRRQAFVGRVNRRGLVVAGLEAVGPCGRQRLAGAERRLARIALGRVDLPLILD